MLILSSSTDQFERIIGYVCEKILRSFPDACSKSLVYFDDAESQAITELLKKADWSEVKAEIGRSIVNYIKIATAG